MFNSLVILSRSALSSRMNFSVSTSFEDRMYQAKKTINPNDVEEVGHNHLRRKYNP